MAVLCAVRDRLYTNSLAFGLIGLVIGYLADLDITAKLWVAVFPPKRRAATAPAAASPAASSAAAATEGRVVTAVTPTLVVQRTAPPDRRAPAAIVTAGQFATALAGFDLRALTDEQLRVALDRLSGERLSRLEKTRARLHAVRDSAETTQAQQWDPAFSWHAEYTNALQATNTTMMEEGGNAGRIRRFDT